MNKFIHIFHNNSLIFFDNTNLKVLYLKIIYLVHIKYIIIIIE